MERENKGITFDTSLSSLLSILNSCLIKTLLSDDTENETAYGTGN